MIRKKILVFIDSLGSGGAQRRSVNIAVLLKNRGYNVSFLVYHDDMFFAGKLHDNNIPVTIIKGVNYLDRIIKIRTYLNKIDVDVVISFMETPNFIACVSKIGHKKWALITTESSAKMSTFLSKKNKFYNLFHRLSDVKVCNSFNALRMWEKYYPQYADSYKVIYNPVMIDKDLLKECRSLDHKKKEIIVAASYQELKNPIRLIEALNRLNSFERQLIHIDWYGRRDTIIYTECLNLIERDHLEDTISFHGESRDIYSIMKESHCVALFSTVEGMPNTICEGITLGKIILMSKVSDYDVLVNGNGFLCDPFSVDSICETLKKFIYLGTQEMGEMMNRSEELSKLFEPDNIMDDWEKIINAIS